MTWRGYRRDPDFWSNAFVLGSFVFFVAAFAGAVVVLAGPFISRLWGD